MITKLWFDSEWTVMGVTSNTSLPISVCSPFLFDQLLTT